MNHLFLLQFLHFVSIILSEIGSFACFNFFHTYSSLKMYVETSSPLNSLIKNLCCSGWIMNADIWFPATHSFQLAPHFSQTGHQTSKGTLLNSCYYDLFCINILLFPISPYVCFIWFPPRSTYNVKQFLAFQKKFPHLPVFNIHLQTVFTL